MLTQQGLTQSGEASVSAGGAEEATAAAPTEAAATATATKKDAQPKIALKLKNAQFASMYPEAPDMYSADDLLQTRQSMASPFTSLLAEDQFVQQHTGRVGKKQQNVRPLGGGQQQQQQHDFNPQKARFLSEQEPVFQSRLMARLDGRKEMKGHGQRMGLDVTGW